mgnify:CR=1 FL=1
MKTLKKFTSIFSIINFIISHPLNKNNKIKSVIRFIKWQINTKLNSYPIIYPFTDKAKLIVQKGMTGATGNLYCGLHEFNEMSFLLHFLRNSDLFIDVGANIGSYTILASAHIGSKSLSIEPAPSSFINLSNNIHINKIDDKVRAYNLALGAQNGYANFTSLHDTTNHIVTEEKELNININDIIKVKITTLDEIINSNPDILLPVILMKIDTEGFEKEVLRGSEKLLKKNELKAIIIELNEREQIDNILSKFGFKPFQYEPFSRTLNSLDLLHTKTSNAIYIRDLDFVELRLKTAEKFNVLNQLI